MTILSAFALAVAAAASPTGTPAQIEIPDWENSVRFELVASQTPIRPGDALKLAVLAELDPGYHLYGPEEAFPTATQVEIVEGGPFAAGEPDYPAPIRRDLSGLGEYDLYEGEIAIRIPVSASRDVSDPAAAEVLLRYQLCTDNACSAPTSTTLRLELPVGREGARVRALNEKIFGEAR